MDGVDCSVIISAHDDNRIRWGRSYRIPLPVVLSDSTHGDIAEFELVTVRVRDAAGAAGLGYTYTVGRGGAAVAALIKHDLCSVLLDAEADRIEALWQRMWWAIHYGGRGG